MKKLNIEPLKINGFSEEDNILATERIERFLKSWEGTRYFAGQNVRGMGVDCVHFVSSIYDELLGTNFNRAKLPQDISFHNKALAEASLKQFFRMYPCDPVEGDVVQPGDVIICGPVGKNGGPGHGMIVGTDSLWHVSSTNVCKAGLGVMQKGAYAFKQIRRLRNRSKMLDRKI